MLGRKQVRNKPVLRASESRRDFCGEVARVAYALYEQRGRNHGRDQDDWFEAERIVKQRWEK